MADPRDLIQRLANALTAHGPLPGAMPLLAEARTYLATPEPAAGPTDEQRFEHWWHHEGSAPPVAGTDLEEHTHRTSRIAWLNGAYCARYGHQPPKPIPLSERLPGPEDCDAEGRCWWWIVEQPGQFPHWIYAPRGVVSWAGYLAWLPHHALPLPEAL